MAQRKAAGSSESVAELVAVVGPAVTVIRAVRHFTDSATNRDFKPGDSIDWPANKVAHYLSVEPPLIGVFTE